MKDIKLKGGLKMNNYYYVEFVGGLKDDKVIQKIFAKHYNKMCEYTN